MVPTGHEIIHPAIDFSIRRIQNDITDPKTDDFQVISNSDDRDLRCFNLKKKFIEDFYSREIKCLMDDATIEIIEEHNDGRLGTNEYESHTGEMTVSQ